MVGSKKMLAIVMILTTSGQTNYAVRQMIVEKIIPVKILEPRRVIKITCCPAVNMVFGQMAMPNTPVWLVFVRKMQITVVN